MPRRPARKAVIPVAGLGTRFLPVTKAVPKELLPVVDRPALQYIVEEAARAGLGDVLMVTGRNKGAIEDYFDRHPELETALEKKGDEARLAAVHESTDVASVHFVRQGEARGLGHAVLQAAAFVGEEPFAVLLGDDLIDARDHLLEQMLEVQGRHGGSVIALLDVGRENIDKYGAVAVRPSGDRGPGDEVVEITGLVEKPPVEEAPSSLAIIGRYVLAPEVFDVLRETPPGRGGEIQLTDALATLVQRGEPLHGVVFTGRRYDTGDRLDYLKAVVQLAVERDDLGPPLREWLAQFVAELPAKGASPI
jgi:UTP--glucose-1-phosphate uridylyltransferase